MKYLIFVFIFLVSGCVSLKDQIYSIQKGDTKNIVISKLGNPIAWISDEKDPAITYLGYQRRMDQCIVAVKEEKVIDTSCKRNPNYVNPIAAAFSGMGNGLQNANKNNLHCTTTGSEGFYSTNCN